jgi:hypothetical protein
MDNEPTGLRPCTAAKDKDRLSLSWSQSLDVDYAARSSLGESQEAPVRIYNLFVHCMLIP